MISEGTNIPRLQVCCHLTRIRTEMHFRQVLGRVLRHTNNGLEKGYLVIPAARDFIEFSSRISEEIPESAVIQITRMDEKKYGNKLTISIANDTPPDSVLEQPVTELEKPLNVIELQTDFEIISHRKTNTGSLRLFGQYRTELLSLFG